MVASRPNTSATPTAPSRERGEWDSDRPRVPLPTRSGPLSYLDTRALAFSRFPRRLLREPDRCGRATLLLSCNISNCIKGFFPVIFVTLNFKI